jgi:hypothetical protein
MGLLCSTIAMPRFPLKITQNIHLYEMYIEVKFSNDGIIQNNVSEAN